MSPTVVVHKRPVKINGNTYKPGDVVRGDDAQALLDHELHHRYVTRVRDDAHPPQEG